MNNENKICANLSMQIDECETHDDLEEAKLAIESAYEDDIISEDNYDTLMDEWCVKFDEIDNGGSINE